MENILRNDFITHYGLQACTETNLTLRTDKPYFEIEDTVAREIEIHTVKGQGMARFSNPSQLTITITNYDKFITCLPNSFQNRKKRCDIIVVDEGDRYFVLGEIKDSPNVKNHRKTARKQLLDSLTTLVAVPNISELINGKTVKRCCYFNKQPNSPAILSAVSAFNRLSTLFPDGFKMNHTEIELQNFEFWEYLGEQTLTLTKEENNR
jgi:hypothetical protein